MVFQGLDAEQAKKVWQPFLAWVARSPKLYSVGRVVVGSLPAQRMWDMQWLKEHWPEIAIPDTNALIGLFDYALAHVFQPIFEIDDRPEAGPNNTWWKGDAGQVGWFIWGYESLWLPASLLESDSQQRLADALFSSSRYSSVLKAFALAIVADGQGPAYPRIPGHEPSIAEGRKAAGNIDKCIDQLRAVTGQTGAYVSESNYFEKGWQQAYWGSNYPRLAVIKKKYDPDGLFFVHNGVGSEQWSPDGFTKL